MNKHDIKVQSVGEMWAQEPGPCDKKADKTTKEIQVGIEVEGEVLVVLYVR